MSDEIKKANLKEKALWFAGKRFRFEIEGKSMSPILLHEDEVLVKPSISFEVGDIVIAKHPIKISQLIVKKITKRSKKGFRLEGVNKRESSDSRILGDFSEESIIGKVTSVL